MNWWLCGFSKCWTTHDTQTPAKKNQKSRVWNKPLLGSLSTLSISLFFYPTLDTRSYPLLTCKKQDLASPYRFVCVTLLWADFFPLDGLLNIPSRERVLERSDAKIRKFSRHSPELISKADISFVSSVDTNNNGPWTGWDSRWANVPSSIDVSLNGERWTTRDFDECRQIWTGIPNRKSLNGNSNVAQIPNTVPFES